ncbi:MAG: response regulator transcription factor [Gammaproteobacteria bacterium]|nr:response regulator transcription factor [Gammaproteobacteria bacterium]
MKNQSGLTVLLVDDHAIVRLGYVMLLNQLEQIDTILEAENGTQAYRIYSRQQPDLVIMDLSLPGVGGLATIRKIIKRDEHAKILVFSIHDELIYINRALDSGAMGYITKSSPPALLIQALLKVSNNELFIQPELAQKLVKQQRDKNTSPCITDQLSAREFEVLQLIAQGFSTQAAAQQLNLSAKTISNYMSVIKNKLDVTTDIELVHVAYSTGLIEKK